MEITCDISMPIVIENKHEKKTVGGQKKSPRCPECGCSDISRFYRDSKGQRTNAHCKECHKKRCNDRYHKNNILEINIKEGSNILLLRMEKFIKEKGNPTCSKCGEADINEFYYTKDGKVRCKKCHGRNSRDRYRSNGLDRNRALRSRRYGLSPEDYIKMYKKQEGRCAICGEEPSTKRGLAIDHCHITGKVRGLLCHGCNIGIGSMKDSAVLLLKAIRYLEVN